MLVPRLGESWDDLLREFGAENVLIVSNSAGTGKDSLLLQVRVFLLLFLTSTGADLGMHDRQNPYQDI